MASGRAGTECHFMRTIVLSTIFAISLFFGMLALLETGRRLGQRRLKRDPDGARAGAATVEGAILALLGLLVAFTFSGAASRFDTRRQLIVQEANVIGTAWLRLDLLPENDRAALQDLFRRYLDSRLEIYRKLADIESARQEFKNSTRIQGEIWSRAVAACRAKGDAPTTSLLLSSLNEMIDITTTRAMALQTHPPMIIYALLFAVGLGCSLLAGYGMAGGRERSWAHMISFAAIVAVTVYVILDLEFPRLGLIRVDAADKALIVLRESMR